MADWIWYTTPKVWACDRTGGDIVWAVATERSKRELAQRESNKKGIADMGDSVPAPEKQKVRAILSEEMTGTKETLGRDDKRRWGRRWADTRRI